MIWNNNLQFFYRGYYLVARKLSAAKEYNIYIGQEKVKFVSSLTGRCFENSRQQQKILRVFLIYVCVISSLNVNISRETLFLTDIYIINLFVLMSFDNYINLILKTVDSYLSF